MKIKPKTEEELNAFDCLPPGEYPATVLESDEIASKSEKNRGKMMFKLKLSVHGQKFDKHVYDYFADWFSEWKLRHFAEAAGLLSEYDSGEMDGASNAFEGRGVFVKLEKESDSYGEKNVVKDYVVKKAEKQAAPVKPSALPSSGGGDDVPF